jgi:hypothetical protein
MFTNDRVFQEYDQKTFWGCIEEFSDKKIVIKWDSFGNLGQSQTTFHGDLSAVTRYRDCWQVKF